MKRDSQRYLTMVTRLFLGATVLLTTGCFHHHQYASRRAMNRSLPSVDRPFPVGQVTDAFWDTQMTNAEAADFIFYDHEFRGDTAELTPGGKRHLQQVALRHDHVPFPIVIEQSMYNAKPRIDMLRRREVMQQLARMGVTDVERRVVVAEAFPRGFRAEEAMQAAQSLFGFGNQGGGGGFGGGGGGFGGGFGGGGGGFGGGFGGGGFF